MNSRAPRTTSAINGPIYRAPTVVDLEHPENQDISNALREERQYTDHSILQASHDEIVRAEDEAKGRRGVIEAAVHGKAYPHDMTLYGLNKRVKTMEEYVLPQIANANANGAMQDNDAAFVGGDDGGFSGDNDDESNQDPVGDVPQILPNAGGAVHAGNINAGQVEQPAASHHALAGQLMNALTPQFNAMNDRFNAVDGRFNTMDGRLNDIQLDFRKWMKSVAMKSRNFRAFNAGLDFVFPPKLQPGYGNFSWYANVQNVQQFDINQEFPPLPYQRIIISALMGYSKAIIVSLSMFYNDDFGIQDGDTVAQMRQCLQNWLMY